ncbi:putative Serpin family protein [Helianthus anomalus]
MPLFFRPSIFNNLKPIMLQQRCYAFKQHRLVQSISNQTHVSTTLATHLFSNKHDSNVVFSPLSIQNLLSLLAAGSKDQTLDQLLAFLKADTTDDLKSLYSQLVSSILADGSPTGGPKLSFANAVWVHKTLPLNLLSNRLLTPFIKGFASKPISRRSASNILFFAWV